MTGKELEDQENICSLCSVYYSQIALLEEYCIASIMFLEDPNFGQGQAEKTHLKLRKHSKRLKKQSKALLSGRNKLPSSACAKENVDEDRAASQDIDTKNGNLYRFRTFKARMHRELIFTYFA